MCSPIWWLWSAPLHLSRHNGPSNPDVHHYVSWCVRPLYLRGDDGDGRRAPLRIRDDAGSRLDRAPHHPHEVCQAMYTLTLSRLLTPSIWCNMMSGKRTLRVRQCLSAHYKIDQLKQTHWLSPITTGSPCKDTPGRTVFGHMYCKVGKHLITLAVHLIKQT